MNCSVPPSAVEIAEGVATGSVSAGDVIARSRVRAGAVRESLNALVQERWTGAEAEAAETDARRRRGPLAGVPVSVKECFGVSGLRTTLGLETRRDAVDVADAPLVAAVRRAGGIVIGKGNVPQAMMLHETDNPVWGRTNHPSAADRGPGGSSGGDAALVAAGVVPIAIGNDLAGSLRQPAHACGIATIMPRSTALGEGGAADILPHLTAVRPRAGFLAATVDDLRLALQAVDAGALPARPVAGLRIAWWDDGGPIPASPAVRRAVDEAVAALAAAGAGLTRLDGGVATEAAWLHLAILAADGGSDVRAALAGRRPIRGVRRLLRLAALPRWARPMVASVVRAGGRGLEARAILATGRRTAAELGGLIEARVELARLLSAAVAGHDAIVCPVSALPALRHSTAARLVLAAAPCLLANLLDLSAGAVPVTTVRADEESGRPFSCDPVLWAAAACDRGSRGLPVGVQVVACPGRDESIVLDVMRAIEASRRGRD